MSILNEYQKWESCATWTDTQQKDWLMKAINLFEHKLTLGQDVRNQLYETVIQLQNKLKAHGSDDDRESLIEELEATIEDLEDKLNASNATIRRMLDRYTDDPHASPVRVRKEK